jgi:hypothetical protein
LIPPAVAEPPVQARLPFAHLPLSPPKLVPTSFL